MHRYKQVAPALTGRGRNRGLGVGAGLMLLMCGTAASAQEHTVVSNRIEVSASEASLHLEFADGQTLEIGFANGIATLNGDVLGEYVAGGGSDQAWRGLLEDVQSLAGEPLALELDRWSPGPGSESADLELLRRVEAALDQAFAGVAQLSPNARAEAGARTELGAGDLANLIGRSPEFFRALAAATEDVDLASAEIRIGQDHTIPEDALIDGSVLHVGGDLDVRGRIRGNLIVMDGSVALVAGSQVGGDLRLLDAGVDDTGGVLAGEWVDLRRQLDLNEIRLREGIRAELVQDLDRRNVAESRRPSVFLQRTRQATTGVFDTVVAFLVLGLMTLLLTLLGGHRVRSVVSELENNPLGSILAGFAGGYAVLPVFILGIAALTVTLIGIPALLVWVPFFPLAVGLAVFAGFVGVADHIGRRVLQLDLGWLNRLDGNTPLHARLAGIATLLLPFVVGNVLLAIPVVDALGGILCFGAILACIAAATMGFGAVIITRGGTRDAHWSRRFSEESFGTEDWTDEQDCPPDEGGGAADRKADPDK